jgi:hypothetical protein
MSDYVVLLHEKDPARASRTSPTEMQAIIQRYRSWIGQLRQNGQLEASRKLTDEGGRWLRRDKGAMLASDGPYAEAKDIVSGLFIIKADSYEDAQRLLQDCPHLDFGWIELRQVHVV